MTDDLDKYFDPNDDESVWLPNKVVARQFGIDPSTLRHHRKNHPELLVGVHWIHASLFIKGQSRKVLCWSQHGINELSQILTTDNAIEHRNQILVPIDKIFQALIDIRPHLEAHEDRITHLEGNLCSPVEYSKLQNAFSNKRFELFQKGYPWKDVHDIAKGWTGLSKYTDMNIGQIEEGIKNIDRILGGN